eukprot:maker-scaffold372_size192401-snap-gene-0.50 protein:Tk00582 transcript:maker-scaffold372_size192401-snap-gene-0.50-mRNA-1 annotation:"rcc1 and btb domain-containing protein 1"
MDLDSWTIFSLLEPDFVRDLRLICVFGFSGNEAIMVTNSDQVYSLGCNGSSCLGLGDTCSTIVPKKLEQLCNKGVKSFAYGTGPHVLACTESGELYSWGHNGYCQLGNGSTNQGNVPAQVQGALKDKIVTDIACGAHHSLCLTDSGEIFAWGQNTCGQIGSGTTTNQSSPRKVSTLFAGKNVMAVACGQTSSLALLDNGEVYSWGYNGNGQLGLGNNINQLNPSKVTALQNVVISKVVCGYAHTLALSDEGTLFGWGANTYGQLGTGNKANSCCPTKVATEIGRIVDIAASHYNHISAAITQDSKVYMWGQCHGQSVRDPTLTSFRSLHEVLARYGCPAVTHVPMKTEAQPGPSLKNALKLAFNDPNTSDVKFVVDNRDIHVHKALLKIRCEHFRSMFQNHWKEGKDAVIEIDQFPYPVYRAFLEYLYTDEVNLSTEDAVELLDLANAYCEVQLKRRCELLIQKGINIENVCMLYSTALRFNAEELESFCFRFSLNHMTAVVQTDSFEQMEERVLKEFISKSARHGAFKS